jgi:hypothetical protein
MQPLGLNPEKTIRTPPLGSCFVTRSGNGGDGTEPAKQFN